MVEEKGEDGCLRGDISVFGGIEWTTEVVSLMCGRTSRGKVCMVIKVWR